MYKPYTYLIGWSKLDRWYYGSQTRTYRKIAHPSNLWTVYFTSSKHVKSFREAYGEPDVIEVRRVFATKQDAVEWEHRVLRRMKARTSERWLNRSDTKVHDRTGVPHSEEVKAKMSIARNGRQPMLGKKHSEETKRMMSESRKGKKRHFSPETREKMRQRLLREPITRGIGLSRPGELNPMFGKKHSAETREKIRQKALLRRKQELGNPYH